MVRIDMDLEQLLDKFCEVEHETFRRDRAEADSEVSIERAKVLFKAFEDRIEFELADGFSMDELMEEGVSIIYGLGGMNRYFVRGSGSIQFSARHSNDAGIAKAVAAGFEISR